MNTVMQMGYPDGLSRLPVNWLMLSDVVLSLHSLT